ncbi:MAG: tRNA 2-thiocytidine biosynthesis TtcA family protein, partial [Candidatus Omnitrophica bacterium]|nr:tRNA 2-thiocytidine biosynthesis TtcA family protein [Candidatus Omnitrophota bacterium]
MGEAIRDYALIQEGDRIAVAVSGGQDSLTMLKMLSTRTMMSALKYTLMAIHIETDFSCAHCTHRQRLTDFFDRWGVAYEFGKASVVQKAKGRPINCFWCAWNKRKEIFTIAERNGCNKIAFGHHKDDIIETVLLNLFFNGEVSTMNPRQEMFGGKITIIRPL